MLLSLHDALPICAGGGECRSQYSPGLISVPFLLLYRIQHRWHGSRRLLGRLRLERRRGDECGLHRTLFHPDLHCDQDETEKRVLIEYKTRTVTSYFLMLVTVRF